MQHFDATRAGGTVSRVDGESEAFGQNQKPYTIDARVSVSVETAPTAGLLS